MVVEFLNDILGTHRHIKGACIAKKVRIEIDLFWCLLQIKSG